MTYRPAPSRSSSPPPPEDAGLRMAGIAFHASDETLAHGLLDLARTARRELSWIEKAPFVRPDRPTYVTALLQQAIPEIARRLNAGASAPFLFPREEAPGRLVRGIRSDALRFLSVGCWFGADFAGKGRYIRELAGYDIPGVSACEALGRDPALGNILEIALQRVAPPGGRPDKIDRFARAIASAQEDAGRPPRTTWSTDMSVPGTPFPDNELPALGELGS